MTYEKIDRYLQAHLDESIQELSDLCKIPTISAQKLNLDEGAAFVADLLKKRGFHVEIHPTKGAPIVFAERKGKSDKTKDLFQNLMKEFQTEPKQPKTNVL